MQALDVAHEYVEPEARTSIRRRWPRSNGSTGGAARLKNHGDPTPGPRLIAGDNLAALAALMPEVRERVTLAYLDPPFLTGKQHARVKRQRDRTGRIIREQRAAFDDRWSSLREYLDVLAPRLELLRTSLASHGSLVVHVDPKTSHYVKVLCDEVFGPDAFASEIIWRYRRWPAKTPNFQRVHDVLLRYVKDPKVKPRFNQLYEPLAPSTLATWGKRKQRAVVDKNGRRCRSSKTEGETPGAPLGDVWEIGIVAPVAKERTGYPTQKPLTLMRRLVDALTSEGDLVLDPYCGSGTTLVAAHEATRHAIGIDQSPEAIEVCQERLANAGIWRQSVTPAPAKAHPAPRPQTT